MIDPAEQNNKADEAAKDEGFLHGLIPHLIELRNRLLNIMIVLAVLVVGLLPFADQLYSLLADPLLRNLPQGSSMVAIDVASPLLTPFKLTMVLAVFIAVPYIFYHLWAFVAPGLYQHERRLALPLVVSSTLLFYMGVSFAYFIVFPVVFAFFIAAAPEGVAVMTDIGRYLDFVITSFMAFGIAFEIPIATVLLVMAGVTTADKLAAMRAYVIVGAFVAGMLLTPPDVISQLLLAIPMWLLFEIGILVCRTIVRKKKEA